MKRLNFESRLRNWILPQTVLSMDSIIREEKDLYRMNIKRLAKDNNNIFLRLLKKKGGRENYSIPKSWLKFRRLFDHSFPLEKRSICWSLGVKTTIKVSLREIGYTRILRHPFIPPYRKRLLEAISWAARRASCDLGAHSNGLERGPRNFHHRNHCREDSL